MTDFGDAAAPAEPWVELDAVREALDSDAVLVELAHFWVYDFSAAHSDKPWRTTHYAAWIIPPAGKGEVRIVDLGEAKTVEPGGRGRAADFPGPAWLEKTRPGC